jgi:hypothetical protein
LAEGLQREPRQVTPGVDATEPLGQCRGVNWQSGESQCILDAVDVSAIGPGGIRRGT